MVSTKEGNSADRGWIERADSLLALTQGMDPSERRRFLETRQRDGSGSAQVAHRQMIALTWLKTRLKTTALTLDDVVASYRGVEAMARLEASRPLHAERSIRDVLTGKISSRQADAMASIARIGTGRRVAWPNEWEVFLQDFIAPMMPVGAANIAYATNEVSEFGRLLHVDVEWNLKNGNRAAVFLSTSLIWAQSSNFAELFPRILAARVWYHHVAFYTGEEEERAVLRRFAGPDDQLVAPLIIA